MTSRRFEQPLIATIGNEDLCCGWMYQLPVSNGAKYLPMEERTMLTICQHILETLTDMFSALLVVA